MYGCAGSLEGGQTVFARAFANARAFADARAHKDLKKQTCLQ